MKRKLLPLQEVAEFQAERSLAEQLPYWDLGPNEVVLIDGSVATGLKLQGVSLETFDNSRINQIAQDLRSVLNSLPDGCEVSFVYSLDSKYQSVLKSHEALKGQNQLANWLTHARVNSLERESDEKLLLKPSLNIHIYHRYQGSQLASKLSFFSSPKIFTQVRKSEYEQNVKELHQTVDTLSVLLEGVGITTKKLSGEEIWENIYAFLNPNRSKAVAAPVPNASHRIQEFSPAELQRVPALSYSSPRQQLVFSDVISQYDLLYFDGLYHRCITLSTMPEFTHTALVSRLMQLPFPHSLHVHVKVPEQSKELSLLQAKRRMAHSMSLSQSGRATDLESEARLSSAEDLLREIINTGQKIFYFQCTVLLRADSRDELEMQTKATLAKFRELNGAEALVETVGTLKVWKTLLPFGNLTTVRPKRVKADNLADFVPIYQPYEGIEHQPVCLFKNRWGGLVKYDPFSPKLPNYNTLVTGSSGAGKSFVNNLVLLQYVSQNPLIYVIDIGGSYRKLCEALDGQYIEVMPPGADQKPNPINPFELPPRETRPTAQKLKFLMAFLESILTDDKAMHLPKLEKSLLEEAVVKLYETHTGSKAPCLSDLASQLSQSDETSLRNFSKMLYPWTGERPYGRLLDGENTFDVNKNVVVFDLKGLTQYPDLQAVMLLIITDFILGRVEGAKGKRKQILMDECWELLKSPASQNFMEYCVRTLRKSGSGITFITQGLEEIVASSIGPAILSNTATKFILLQRGDLEPIRNILKLNEQEMALISSLRQAKGLYSEAFLMANEARTVIRAVPTPEEYWLATSDAADNELIEATRQKHPKKTLLEIITELAHHYPKGAAGGNK